MNCIVIGGGASGALSAYFLAKNGFNVILLEKNEKIGKKLYITGKGRCNLTNDCDAQEFLNNVVTNSKFMISSVYGFPPSATIELFESLGLCLKTERGNRVFPLSDKSSDVIKVLQSALVKEGVNIHFNEQALEILTENNVIKGVVSNKATYLADRVIVATGGLSYPSTGSTGDGYKFAKQTGHLVNKLSPSLCGFNLCGSDFVDLQGLTLKNIKISAFDEGNEYFSNLGEALFTHYGISGPLILTCSALTTKRTLNNITISIDLKPALDNKQLDARILRDFDKFKNKELKNSLFELLPKKLIPLIIKRSLINPDKKVNTITLHERENLIKVIKNLTFKISSLRGFNEAVITSGGVCVNQINPKTMESKVVKGLYFIGEVLDVDAFTGGFNLQIAFSTAKACSKT